MRLLRPFLAALVAGALLLTAYAGLVAYRYVADPDHSEAAALRPAVGTTTLMAPDGVGTTLLAAGDIATCDGSEARTGALLAATRGVVAPLGDLAYPNGEAVSFAECYDPAWGAVRDRTRPTMGNHDARTADASGYFGYFGDAAGPDPQGYYSYDLGQWHVVVLNSNCEMVGGCGPGDPQIAWLQDDLAATDRPNLLAYWHHPRFSTGDHGDDTDVATFWDVLHDAGADLVLNGHDHDYQRFVPMAPDGTPDADGIVQFVVGTGGKGFRDFSSDRDTIAFRQNTEFGVLQLDLLACGFDWAFLPVSGDPPLDGGSMSGTCEG